jgi:hypothetical protein
MAPVEFYDDIYEYYYPPFWESLLFKITVGIILVALIALGIWLYLRTKKKPLSAWEWAHLELSNLTPSRYNTKDDFKKFYFALTSIVKNYLHKRYEWQTVDKTDSELIGLLEQQQFDQEIIDMLKKISESAVWIKFANMDALKSQAETDWKMIASMIIRTTPNLQTNNQKTKSL